MLIVRLTLLGVAWEEMPLKTCFLANEKQPATGGRPLQAVGGNREREVIRQSRLLMAASMSFTCTSRSFTALSFPMRKNVGRLCTL